MKIRTQILFITLIPLIAVLATNYYQASKFEELLKSKLNTQIDATKKRLLFNLRTNILNTKKISQLLSKNYEIVRAIETRDSDLLFNTSKFYIDSKLISNIIFIDKNHNIISRGNDEYKFNDSAKALLNDTSVTNKKIFTGLFDFDKKYQYGTITPIYKFDVEIIGYVLVSHIIDKSFLNSLVEQKEYLLFDINESKIDNIEVLDDLGSDLNEYSLININFDLNLGKSIENQGIIVFKDFTEEKQFIKDSKRKQNFLIFIMLIVLPLTIIFLVRKILEPLQNFNSYIQKFSNEDITLKTLILNLKKPLNTNKEISQINDSVLMALQTLQDTQNKLIDSRKELKETNKIKNEFFLNMSEEIKSPINSIINLSEKILKNDLEDKKHIKLIKESANSILNIVTYMMDLSRIESENINLIKRYNYLPKIFNQLNKLFEIELKEKDLKYNTIYEDEMKKYEFKLDEFRLKQILINLISNSIKFTKKGKIELVFDFIKTSDNTSNLQISIKDSGIGMSNAKQKKVFEEFFQNKNSIDNNYSTVLGLGLTIIKRLLVLMNGSIEIYSNKNAGSTFTIYLKDIPIREKLNDI